MKDAVAGYISRNPPLSKSDVDFTKLTIEVISLLADKQPNWMLTDGADFSKTKRRFRSLYDLIRQTMNNRGAIRNMIRSHTR